MIAQHSRSRIKLNRNFENVEKILQVTIRLQILPELLAISHRPKNYVIC